MVPWAALFPFFLTAMVLEGLFMKQFFQLDALPDVNQ